MATMIELEKIARFQTRMVPLLDREDIRQEAVTKMWTNGCLDNGSPSTKNKSYAAFVAHSVVVDYFRRCNGNVRTTQLVYAEDIAVNGLEHSMDIKMELEQFVKRVWAQLSTIERWALAAYVRNVTLTPALSRQFWTAMYRIRRKAGLR